MAGSVLITGVSSFWGTELAHRLERDPSVDHVIGIDVVRPRARFERTEFIEADIRSPLISSLLPTTEVDTVVHMGVLRFAEPGKSDRLLHDFNVIGALQLLAACEKVPTLKSIIVRGSAAIYGSEPNLPDFMSEDTSRTTALTTPFQYDVRELENYFEGFARRRPDVTCTVLRFQPSIGPRVDSPLSRYLNFAFPPTHLGFDPLLQFVDEEDFVGSMLATIANPVQGPVNVAGTGTITLSRLLALVGKTPLPVPHPACDAAISAMVRLGAGRSLPRDFIRLLRFGRTVDIGRLMDEVGYRPVNSCEDIAHKYAHVLRRSTGRTGLRSAVARSATG